MPILAAKGEFPLGSMLMTRGVADRCAEDERFSAFVLRSLGRHGRGDWGNLSPGDKRENESSLTRRLRLFSAYEQQGMPKIWIITEADRSATTVIFPDEY